jgi:hypothetical protein
MEDRAEALGNLPAPKLYASVELSGICRVWGGALSQELSSDDNDDDQDALGQAEYDLLKKPAI